MESLVQLLNEDHILNQEKHNNEIKSMKQQYNVKYNHTKYERETNSKRITLLETRNAKLQDTVNNKSEIILNLARQIEKIEGEILKTVEVDIIAKEKLKDWKANYISLEEYLTDKINIKNSIVSNRRKKDQKQ